MQLLLENSTEEKHCEGLGVIKGVVRPLVAEKILKCLILGGKN